MLKPKLLESEIFTSHLFSNDGSCSTTQEQVKVDKLFFKKKEENITFFSSRNPFEVKIVIRGIRIIGSS